MHFTMQNNAMRAVMPGYVTVNYLYKDEQLPIGISNVLLIITYLQLME